ncbi:hypothetical protein HAX54_021277 [Datura stramonium]|uniref:Uncharacterized protein n=1 Tax=Datura stramonium TaxID=4076 RepID=A0ABS8S3M0_DATST|nr:hypothetical protein [Datura stramonium]
MNGIEQYFLDILCQIAARAWQIFIVAPGRYFPPLVCEFYASYGADQKYQKATGLLRSRPCLEKVKVRVVQVDCSSKTINIAYFYDDDAKATDYLAKLENPDNHYTWIASLIAVVIVTNLCRDTGVPEIARIDKNLRANQVVDITKIQDEMNSKMKKRKCEPIVSQPSEEAIGLDSQTVDEPSVETLSSSSATPELEHRVSTLEGIGAKKAIVVLKVDISKVKGDVQQLQPDMSIFDAPPLSMDDLTTQIVGVGLSSRVIEVADMLQFPLPWPSLRRPFTPQTQEKFLILR